MRTTATLNIKMHAVRALKLCKMNEWMKERTNERTTEWMSGWIKKKRTLTHSVTFGMNVVNCEWKITLDKDYGRGY